MVGDFNAKHSLWGRQRIDSRGEILLEFINKYDLIMLNDPNTVPTYTSTTGISWIDMILVKNFNINNIFDYKVWDEIHLSDHNLITFKIKNYKRKKELLECT